MRNHWVTCGAAMALFVCGCGERERPTTNAGTIAEVDAPVVVPDQTDGQAPGELAAATEEDLADPPTILALDAAAASGRTTPVAIVRGEAVREPVAGAEHRGVHNRALHLLQRL